MRDCVLFVLDVQIRFGAFTFNQFSKIHYWKVRFCIINLKKENGGGQPSTLSAKSNIHVKKFWCAKALN